MPLKKCSSAKTISKNIKTEMVHWKRQKQENLLEIIKYINNKKL